MLVFDLGFTMWWAARMRSLREKPSAGALGNVSKCLESVQSYSLAAWLPCGALALGPRGPGRLITEAGNS